MQNGTENNGISGGREPAASESAARELPYGEPARIPTLALTSISSSHRNNDFESYLSRSQEKAFRHRYRFSYGVYELPHAEEWFKYYPVNAAVVIKRYLNQKNPKHTALLLYPYIAAAEDTANIKMQIKLIAPIKDLIEDNPIFSVPSQVGTLRNFNRKAVFQYFEYRARNPIDFEKLDFVRPRLLQIYNRRENTSVGPEDFARKIRETPHLLLTLLSNQIFPNYRLLSTEYELIHQANDRLAELALEAYDFAIFRRDTLFQALNHSPTDHAPIRELVLVNEDGTMRNLDLFLPSRDGSIIDHQEIRTVYLILSDFYELKLRTFSTALSGTGGREKAIYTLLEETLQSGELERPREGHLFPRKRVSTLLRQAEPHLLKLSASEHTQIRQWSTYLLELHPVIRALIQELDRKLEKEAQEKIAGRLAEISARIFALSKNDSSLLRLKIDDVFAGEDFDTPEAVRREARTVINLLQKDPFFCWCERDEGEDGTVYYFGDPKYLFLIQTAGEFILQLNRRNRKKDPAATNHYRAVNEIIARLSLTHPHIEDYQDLLRRENENKFNEANRKLMLAGDTKRKFEVAEVRRLKFNFPLGGVGGFLAGFATLLFCMFLLPLSWAAGLGLIVFLATGILLGNFFSENQVRQRAEVRKKKPGKRRKETAGTTGKPMSDGQTRDLRWIDSIEKIIFPEKATRLTDRILNSRDLFNRILGNISRIRSSLIIFEPEKLKKKSDQELADEACKTFQRIYVSMNIPADVSPDGESYSIYFPQKDFFSDRRRNHYADQYQELADSEVAFGMRSKTHYLYQFIADELRYKYFDAKYQNQKASRRLF